MTEPTSTTAATTAPTAPTGPGGRPLVRGTTAEHERTAELLDAELPALRFRDGRYLAWLYDQDPYGEGIYESVDDEDGLRIAHYGLIPQEYRDAAGPAPFVFSLNAVTRSTVHRRGYFSEIGRRIWAEAAEQGVIGVIGVTNDKSLKPVVRQGWRFMGRLPVLVVPPSPVPLGRFTSHDVTEAWLAGDEAAEVLDGLDEHEARHWTNRWTVEHLRWRLAWPGCGPYAVHVGEDVVAVSVLERFKGVPVTVVLKLLPRRSARTPRSGWPAITAACHHHRSPVAVYAGFNRHVVVRGLPAPDRLKPAPLNLMVHSVSDELDQASFALDTFEFLDMDAF